MTKKKKILLLSYYFEPCAYVASNRPSFFASELATQGFEVIVITRHWNGTEQVWADYLKSDNRPLEIEQKGNLTIHRMPYKQKNINSIWSPASKILTFVDFLNGNIHQEVNYYQYKPHIENILLKEKIDLILVSIPPLNALRLTKEVAAKYKVPFFIDVRDYENHNILQWSGKVTLADKIKHSITRFHSMKWFKEAALIFTVTPPLTEYIAHHSGAETITILNGFRQDLLSIEEPSNERFTVTVLGSLYNIPDLKEMVNGFKKLFTKDFSKEIIIQMIGTNTSPYVESQIRSAIPEQSLCFRERLPQQKAQIEAAKSHVFLALGFKKKKGVLGTKTFEYMGLRKPLIQMPGDEDLMEKIIISCNAGFCIRTADDFVLVLEQLYKEWKMNGCIRYMGNMEEIKKYAREEQFKQLLPYFNR